MRKQALKIKTNKFLRQHTTFDDKEVKSDPLIIYGYGVVALFTLMKTLIGVMLFLSVFIALPQILGYIWLPVNNIMDSNFQIYDASLANSGYSYVNTVLVPRQLNSLYIYCEKS